MIALSSWQDVPGAKRRYGGFRMRREDGDRQFVAFVHQLRREQNFTMEQICEGVCTPATIHAMESGYWRPDKPVRDYLLGRLGVEAEDYEHFLNRAEYGRWAAKHVILHCIAYEETDRAENLLKEYRKEYGAESPFEQQFCLCMQVQLMRAGGCPEEELSKLLERAIALTVIKPYDQSMEQLALSVKELNLTLEAERYRKEGERAAQYREIIAYIEERSFDGLSKVKIYPKAVYFWCRCVLTGMIGDGSIAGGSANGSEEGRDTDPKKSCRLEEILRYCERAIKMLRDNARGYYLWELLELEGRLVNAMADRLLIQGQQGRADSLKEWYRERDEWKRGLEKVYQEAGVRKETDCFCYLYVEKGCYCVNDVIRIRRKMLGMSCKALCRDICDVKTLRRLEQKKADTQWAIVIQLLQRLGLPGDFSRTELLTDSWEARKLMEELRDCFNYGQWERAQQLQDRIRELVPMGSRFNRQVLDEQEVSIQYYKKKIDKKEYYQQMRDVLEITLPYEIFLKEGEKYLTNEEQVCIQHMMAAMNKESDECVTCIKRFEEIYQPYIEQDLEETVSSMYEFVMDNIGSILGDLGEYDRSDWYGERILRECLHFRRLGVIDVCLYNRWWNHNERKNKDIPTDKMLDDAEELAKCILFAEMVRDTNGEQFYRRKMDEKNQEII